MSNLIRDAACTCDNGLDAHIMRFRELRSREILPVSLCTLCTINDKTYDKLSNLLFYHRQKHPNHMPGWLEQYEIGKTMQIHEEVTTLIQP